MKAKSCLMIQFIVLDNGYTKEQLSEVFTERIKARWPTAQVYLHSNAQYWKYKRTLDIMYSISHDSIISVQEFITLFKVTWNYNKQIFFDVHLQRSVEEEQAIWNKVSHPSEIFFNDAIEWVNVYTWRD